MLRKNRASVTRVICDKEMTEKGMSLSSKNTLNAGLDNLLTDVLLFGTKYSDLVVPDACSQRAQMARIYILRLPQHEKVSCFL